MLKIPCKTSANKEISDFLYKPPKRIIISRCPEELRREEWCIINLSKSMADSLHDFGRSCQILLHARKYKYLHQELTRCLLQVVVHRSRHKCAQLQDVKNQIYLFSEQFFPLVQSESQFNPVCEKFKDD